MAFEKYSRYGISLLTYMDIYFQMAPLYVKRKMLGSIFPGKLIFQDGKYRTEGMNPALSLILQKTSELQKEKAGNIVISEDVSGVCPKPESNRRPSHYECAALPTELFGQRTSLKFSLFSIKNISEIGGSYH